MRASVPAPGLTEPPRLIDIAHCTAGTLLLPRSLLLLACGDDGGRETGGPGTAGTIT